MFIYKWHVVDYELYAFVTDTCVTTSIKYALFNDVRYNKYGIQSLFHMYKLQREEQTIQLCVCNPASITSTLNVVPHYCIVTSSHGHH
jgi:hypothetical protein